MSRKQTLAFLVSVPAGREDDAVGFLWECGTIGLESTSGPADTAVLRAYFDEAPDLRDRIASALSPIPGARVEPARVPEVDWVARVREGFRPVEVGPFRIVPVWDAPKSQSGPILLVVDPGRAFGTGSHETTRLCLRALAQIATRRPLGRVADVGTGSGILAIAARKLGATHAVGVDVDAEAVELARQHAAQNHVSLPFAVLDGARGLRSGLFDVVVANLMAPLLLERREELVALCSPSGCLILSGLLVTDVAEIRTAYEPFGSVRDERDGEWACLHVERIPR